MASQGSNEISVEFFPEPGFERFVKSMRPEGTYVKWREYIEETLKYPYASFALCASFAAPLLRMLKSPNFIIDFWGHTSVGKTTVLELAASVWGNPHKEAGGLVFGWDSTRVFLERMASFFCDVPIFPDDSQTVDDRTMASMLYQIVNGVGKGRWSVIGIRHTPTWHTVCFSTGERPLTECTTFSGARARTLSFYGSPFPNAGGNFINDLKQGLRENYGHAGPKFIEGILPIWNNVDLSTRAMQHVLSWASGNERYFKESEYESYSQWKEGDYIGIFPHKLEEILEKERFSKKAVLKGWSEKGWIKREDEKHLTCQRYTKIEQGLFQPRRFVVIPWNVIEEFVGK